MNQRLQSRIKKIEADRKAQKNKNIRVFVVDKKVGENGDDALARHLKENDITDYDMGDPSNDAIIISIDKER